MFTFTFLIGLISQLCYGARQLMQWVMTERLKRVVSPTGYWAGPPSARTSAWCRTPSGGAPK